MAKSKSKVVKKSKSIHTPNIFSYYFVITGEGGKVCYVNNGVTDPTKREISIGSLVMHQAELPPAALVPPMPITIIVDFENEENNGKLAEVASPLQITDDKEDQGNTSSSRQYELVRLHRIAQLTAQGIMKFAIAVK